VRDPKHYDKLAYTCNVSRSEYSCVTWLLQQTTAWVMQVS